jgi:hypothetical protein
VQDLPDQSAKSVADGANRLGMSEARDDPTVDDGEGRTFWPSPRRSRLG